MAKYYCSLAIQNKGTGCPFRELNKVCWRRGSKPSCCYFEKKNVTCIKKRSGICGHTLNEVKENLVKMR